MFYRQSGQNKKKVKHYAYSSDDRLGKGYSSVVYRGINQQTNQIIAIKAIDMKGVKDSVSREMLDCQIQALTKLKHPNILRCYDVVRETSHCYIITELCNEGDLSGHLKKKRRLSELQTLKFTKDIVSGFIDMAQRNFLHRDLKLANIFLSNGRAVIADFGFAKKHSNVFQKEKYNVGSPLYMSPEALKKNIYSIKNDIWSIGIMIFELLHGETPWECKTEKELMEKMVKIPVKFSSSLSISQDIKSFIRKCLEVNEESRMSLQDLKEWNNNNSYEKIAQGKMQFLSDLLPLKQILSSKESTNRQPLGQATNRMSSRSQSNATYHSKSIKQMSVRQNVSINMKQNKATTLSKTIIEKNNSILILEINTFRLLFKIHQRIKKFLSEEKELYNIIGNQVIKRVTNMMSIVCPDKQNPLGYKGEEIGLIQLASYLNQQTNSSIKKYKSVIQEYYRKYTSQIKMHAIGRQCDLKQFIKNYLTQGNLLKQNLTAQEMTMFFWMIEYVKMQKSVQKQYLDSVIDPKNQTFTKAYLNDRIKVL